MLITIFACFTMALTSQALMMVRSTRQPAHQETVARGRRGVTARR